MALTLSLTPYTPSCSEQELVAAARDGSDRAFEELYSRYRERIAAFILSKVHDHGRAEDIAQEVFISALRRLRATEQEIAFKPWLYEIAKNACIDEFRRSRRAREVSLDADEEFSGGHRGLLSVAPTPPAAAESKQQINDLQGAFSGLSESQHQLLVMREFEGLSYGAIGERTGMSRQMVESTLFRARRKLSEEYDELASGRRCEQIQAMIGDGRAVSARSVGIRERRRLTRHLAHCQSCRRVARLAGVDETLVKPIGIAAKIAAILPFPIWRWPWSRGAGRSAAGKSAAAKGAAHASGAGSLQSTVGIAAPAASSIGIGQAAATVAALAIAGAGGGMVTGLWTGHHAAASRATGAGIHSGAAQAARASHVLPATVAGGLAGSRASRVRGGASHGAAPRLHRLPGVPASHTAHPAAPRGPSRDPGPVRGRASSSGSKGSGTSRSVTGTARTTVTGADRKVDKVIAGTKSTVNKVVSSTTGTVKNVVTGATGTVNKVVSGATGTVNGVVSGAAGAVEKVLPGADGAVAKVVSGAAQATASGTDGAQHAVTGATQAAGSSAQQAASAASKLSSDLLGN
jgi:RNA polymerase sigma factor (sigma-70 family)